MDKQYSREGFRRVDRVHFPAIPDYFSYPPLQSSSGISFKAKSSLSGGHKRKNEFYSPAPMGNCSSSGNGTHRSNTFVNLRSLSGGNVIDNGFYSSAPTENHSVNMPITTGNILENGLHAPGPTTEFGNSTVGYSPLLGYFTSITLLPEVGRQLLEAIHKGQNSTPRQNRRQHNFAAKNSTRQRGQRSRRVQQQPSQLPKKRWVTMLPDGAAKMFDA